MGRSARAQGSDAGCAPRQREGETLEDVEALVSRTAAASGFDVRALQSNHEGVLIDAVHAARADCAGIVINPGGLTHTSVSLRDAISGVALPVAEVHISDVYAREEFRHYSYIRDIAAVHVVGEGVTGYARATDLLIDIIAGHAAENAASSRSVRASSPPHVPYLRSTVTPR